MEIVVDSFKNAVDGLRVRFYTQDEFPGLKRERLPKSILREAMQVANQDRISYAAGLKGSQLESLIFDLRDSVDTNEIGKAIEILCLRISPRILKLVTILYLYHFWSQGLNESIKELGKAALEKPACAVAGAFAIRFGWTEDKMAEIEAAINESDKDISQCFKTYGIDGKSPFAQAGFLSYLSVADKDALRTNRRWIINAIEHQPSERLVQLINNYLSTFTMVEYNDGVNLAILNKIGQPYVSPDWEVYSVEIRDTFAQWSYLHRLKLHSVGVPKKYEVLGAYFEQVRSSYEIKNDKLLIIDFGEIVVVDISDRPYSFFYQKKVFDQEMEAWRKSREALEEMSYEESDENAACYSAGYRYDVESEECDQPKEKKYLPTFIRIDQKNTTARDFIIEEVEEPCMKLSYEGVDVLYIRELMDIKMGLEPDMRKKQLAKAMKKR